jgi:hypothetical protein
MNMVLDLAFTYQGEVLEKRVVHWLLELAAISLFQMLLMSSLIDKLFDIITKMEKT